MAISWCQQLSLMSSEMVCIDPPVVSIVQFVYCALTRASTPPPLQPHTQVHTILLS